MTGEKPKIDLTTRESRGMVRSTVAGLYSSEAWKLLDAYLEGEELRLVDSIASCSIANEVVRDAGQLRAIRNLRNWPLMMVRTIDHRNQQEDAALKAEKARAENNGPDYPDPTRRPHASR